MVVFFSEIRPHLQQNVLKKLTFRDFSRLSQCSKNSESLSKLLTTRLIWSAESGLELFGHDDCKLIPDYRFFDVYHIVEEFPVKIDFYEILFFECPKEVVIKITELLENGCISTKSIKLSRTIENIEASQFNQLLKVSQIEELRLEDLENFETVFQPEFFKIKTLRIEWAEINFPFNEFLFLKAEELDIKFVDFSEQQLNTFLKQWYTGSREIRDIDLIFQDGNLQSLQDEAIFSGMPHELIWSREFHSKSIVAHIPIEDVDNQWKDAVFHGVKREDGVQLLVRKWVTWFNLQMVEDPYITFKESVTFELE